MNVEQAMVVVSRCVRIQTVDICVNVEWDSRESQTAYTVVKVMSKQLNFKFTATQF